MRIALALLALAACGTPPAAPRPIRFLHTFGAEETELFNATMTELGIAVEAKLAPFARGQQVIGEILRAGTDCPDLIRIDATWLPGLVKSGLLLAVPAEMQAGDWLPEAPGSVQQGIPETIDGLVVLRDASAPAPASASVGDLVAAARAAKHEERRFPLGLRVDGYWFVPWLRAARGDLAAGGISGDGAVGALEAFASLFGDVAATPPPSGGEAPEELRRWTSHDVAYWVTGPWQLGALPDRDRLAVTALEHAPRGGQMLVVPRCAKHPDDGWKLAGVLTSLPVAKRFADTFATVPTHQAALAASPQLVKDLYAALRPAQPLSDSPLTPLLFDDLNPALAAVVAGDATPAEAIEGVRRGWQRLVATERK